jgi:hypothetical protein
LLIYDEFLTFQAIEILQSQGVSIVVGNSGLNKLSHGKETVNEKKIH